MLLNAGKFEPTLTPDLYENAGMSDSIEYNKEFPECTGNVENGNKNKRRLASES